jgi:non-ribosomal peptide synthetase component E (peptide arylation enzyme)
MIQPFELLETAATGRASEIGLVSETRAYSFSEMLDLSREIAAEFHSQGVRPRQVVSTFLPPDLDWLSTLAVFHEAAVPVSLWGIGGVSNLNVSWFVGTNIHSNVPQNQTIILDDALFGLAGSNYLGRPRT